LQFVLFFFGSFEGRQRLCGRILGRFQLTVERGKLGRIRRHLRLELAQCVIVSL
jgi:hypothetical protein